MDYDLGNYVDWTVIFSSRDIDCPSMHMDY